MSIATVDVLHSFIAGDGEWRNAGGRCDLPLEEARGYEAAGYVDIILIDGEPEVWVACCNEC